MKRPLSIIGIMSNSSARSCSNVLNAASMSAGNRTSTGTSATPNAAAAAVAVLRWNTFPGLLTFTKLGATVGVVDQCYLRLLCVPRCWSGTNFSSLSECRVGAHLHQHLAEIVATQHLGESGWDGLQALADVLAVLNLTGGHQGRDIGQHLLVVVGGEVAHPEILYCHAPRFEERLAQLHQRRAARDAVLITIVGDEAANGHPGSRVEQWQYRLEHFATHVLEIDVDAGRAGGGEVRRQGRRKVGDAGVETKLLDHELAFGVAPDDPHHPRVPLLGELPSDLADPAGGRRDYYRLACPG